MRGYQKMIAVGNLGRDPEFKIIQNRDGEDFQVVKFSLAVNEKSRDDSEFVTWFECEMFGKRAAVIDQHVRKGDPLLVEGRIRTSEWADAEGITRRGFKISMIDFQFVPSPNGSQSGAGDGPGPGPGPGPDVPR